MKIILFLFPLIVFPSYFSHPKAIAKMNACKGKYEVPDSPQLPVCQASSDCQPEPEIMPENWNCRTWSYANETKTNIQPCENPEPSTPTEPGTPTENPESCAYKINHIDCGIVPGGIPTIDPECISLPECHVYCLIPAHWYHDSKKQADFDLMEAQVNAVKAEYQESQTWLNLNAFCQYSFNGDCKLLNPTDKKKALGKMNKIFPKVSNKILKKLGLK